MAAPMDKIDKEFVQSVVIALDSALVKLSRAEQLIRSHPIHYPGSVKTLSEHERRINEAYRAVIGSWTRFQQCRLSNDLSILEGFDEKGTTNR